MSYPYFSCNGKILPSDQATVPLDDIAYAYGFGVYETIRISQGQAQFLDLHCERLLTSAKMIGLDHQLTPVIVAEGVQRLIAKNATDACNVKIMLVGGSSAAEATLYMMCLAPLFVDRKLYKEGVHLITYPYERDFPAAKTLNMLPSYLAYRQARQQNAYDALFINRTGNITEGTRTNFMCLSNHTIISPPEEAILPGIMRRMVLDFAQKNGFELVYQDIRPESLDSYEGAFLTSSSSKILPIKSIGGHEFSSHPPGLSSLIQQFETYLDDN